MIKDIPAILTLKDLQQLLHIGKNKALELIHNNIIVGHMVGKRWLIFAEDVIEYMEHV
ncbi:MAG: helix-turn-helix domain-containing protein [Lachnospiraceae bacterium]|nr:helix-turn-helix domain-containing protein [Lachnospiraceae bacterium]